MSTLKTINVQHPTAASANIVLDNLGNVSIPTSGARITGDMSNATVANRLAFQTNTTNSSSILTVIPNGSSSVSAINVCGASDPTNCAIGSLSTDNSNVFVIAGINGTGSYTPMRFFTGGSERVRIDTSGNVGIGTASPASLFNVNGIATLGSLDGVRCGVGTAFVAGQAEVYAQGSVRLGVGTAGSQPLSFYTGSSERMRINSSGNLGVGSSDIKVRFQASSSAAAPVPTLGTASGTAYFTNSDVGYGLLVGVTGGGSPWLQGQRVDGTAAAYDMYLQPSGGNVLIGTSSGAGRLRVERSDNADTAYIVNTNGSLTQDLLRVEASRAATNAYNMIRVRANGVDQFYVTGNGVIYAQNTTVQSASDVRMKENIRDAQEGLDVISALRPVRYDFKAGFGNDRKNQLGFIAQEIEPIFPDAVGEFVQDGETYKSVGPGALIPVLVKAVQELKVELDAVKAELATVKGA